MASTPYKPLHNWLQHHSEQLDVLLGQVRLLRRVTDVIHGYLPQSLASHCIAANINGDALVVGCNSSVWATKLRYHIPTLLGQLSDRSDIPPFSQIRVSPPTPVTPLCRKHCSA